MAAKPQNDNLKNNRLINVKESRINNHPLIENKYDKLQQGWGERMLTLGMW